MFSLNELLNMSVVMLAFREIASIFMAGLPFGLFRGENPFPFPSILLTLPEKT